MQLYISPKLSNEDTKLTQYSIVTVKLSAQVSSSTISKTLETLTTKSCWYSEVSEFEKKLFLAFTSVNISALVGCKMFS